MELDYKAVILSVPFSAMFIIAMWKMDTWTQSTLFSWKIRLMLSIILPIVLYYVTAWQLNR